MSGDFEVGRLTFNPGYCGRCGTNFVGAHYCGGLPSGPPNHVYRHFSEDEIRRIIREELERFRESLKSHSR